MSIYVASAAEARANFKQGPCSRWFQKEARADQADGNFAFQRLRQPLFQPAITPQFKMKREDKLFDSSFIASLIWNDHSLRIWQDGNQQLKPEQLAKIDYVVSVGEFQAKVIRAAHIIRSD